MRETMAANRSRSPEGLASPDHTVNGVALQPDVLGTQANRVGPAGLDAHVSGWGAGYESHVRGPPVSFPVTDHERARRQRRVAQRRKKRARERHARRLAKLRDLCRPAGDLDVDVRVDEPVGAPRSRQAARREVGVKVERRLELERSAPLEQVQIARKQPALAVCAQLVRLTTDRPLDERDEHRPGVDGRLARQTGNRCENEDNGGNAAIAKSHGRKELP